MKYAALWAGLLSAAWGANSQVEEARRLYNFTEFDKSLQMLQSISAKDADVYALIGRNYFMLSDFRKSTEALEQAVAAQPSNSDYALWLGRAYGRRAETSSPFTAPGYASKARQYFEKAVQLNSANLEALNDLFEYYLEAPGILGGGLDKAQRLVEKISAVDASEGHWALYRIAEQRKDYSRAEMQLRTAIEAAPRHVGKVIDLARFLAKQGRYQESEQSFDRAEKIAPGAPKVMYARADVYIKTGRNIEAAKALLQKYLSCALTPDDPPRSEALKLLRKAQGG